MEARRGEVRALPDQVDCFIVCCRAATASCFITTTPSFPCGRAPGSLPGNLFQVFLFGYFHMVEMKAQA